MNIESLLSQIEAYQSEIAALRQRAEDAELIAWEGWELAPDSLGQCNESHTKEE